MKAIYAALLGLMLFPAFAQSDSVPRELVQRLAGSGTQIYVGELPPKARLEFRLPMPPGTRVVGSTASPTTDETFDWVSLYLSSAHTDFDFQAYYRRVFRELGWRQGQTYDQTGFLPSNIEGPDGSLTFCHRGKNKGTDIYLSFMNKPQMTLIDAQISIYSNQSNWGACEMDNSYVEPPLPALVAPEESETETLDMFSGSSPVGNGGSLIILKTELTGADLLEHYTEQLELSGWREGAVLASDDVQVVTYRFGRQGEPYSGTLQITALDEPERYLAQLTVTKL